MILIDSESGSDNIERILLFQAHWHAQKRPWLEHF